MSKNLAGFRLAQVVLLVVTLAATSIDCRHHSPSTYSRIRNFADTIKVVNAHEHQRWYTEHEGHPYSFYTLLAHSYLQADLVSAGAPELKCEAIGQRDPESLWKTYGPYLDFSRNTSYYSHFLAGFRFLYGFNDPYFTEVNVRALSEQIATNYSRLDEWYAKAFRQAGFETMFVDQYWNTFNTELDSRYYSLVLNIDPLVSSISERAKLGARDAPSDNNIYKSAEKDGRPIENLDAYLAAVDRLFGRFRDRNVVCLKNALAYSRTLDYAPVSYESARVLFARPAGSLTQAEKKSLEDFMFRWIIEKAIALDLPIQIHTGYLAGNGNTLENSRPTKLNNLFLEYPKAKFVLFHGGYPWTGDYASLGKMFANVYLDLVWLPQISREAAVRGLDEMLDTVPYNKFFWGGDCHLIEESIGSLIYGKDVVSQVLAMRVERGLMTEGLALDIARGIFRDNALRFFRLKAKS